MFGQVAMALQAVHLEADAFLVCMAHTLSTQQEEVMGLCLSKVRAGQIARIRPVIILLRSDKRTDRVEISPEQLSVASMEAERLAKLMGQPTRVVGWYHSHFPSTIYRMLDRDFVGLIFSCFGEDKSTKTGRIVFTCFQSLQAPKSSCKYERVPVHLIPHTGMGEACLESMMAFHRILRQEEQDAFRKIHSLSHLDPITKIHNGAVFTKRLCSQILIISGPLMQWALQQEKQKLLEELAALEREEQNLTA
uniref:JAB1/MPN/MOV34 metalloenzyme domain-containing protein n=1 Tax=Podarcis muralis TaxID=64176 RepID=A0A670JH12_PODMU